MCGGYWWVVGTALCPLGCVLGAVHVCDKCVFSSGSYLECVRVFVGGNWVGNKCFEGERGEVWVGLVCGVTRESGVVARFL